MRKRAPAAATAEARAWGKEQTKGKGTREAERREAGVRMDREREGGVSLSTLPSRREYVHERTLVRQTLRAYL